MKNKTFFRYFRTFQGILLFSVCSICFGQQARVAEEAPPDGSLRESQVILQKVSELTGMPVRYPVKEGQKTVEEVTAYIMAEFKDAYPGDTLEKKEKIFKAFRLIPDEMDLEQFLIALYTEQTGAFYDPDTKAYYTVDREFGALENRMIQAHELTHALQDQNFNLMRFNRITIDNDDYDLAKAAVIEGEATMAMIEYLLQDMGVEDTGFIDWGFLLEQIPNMTFNDPNMEIFNRAPEFIKNSLLFPYVKGASFISALLKSGWDWEKLGSLFSDMPLTTEQILHPEKYYLQRDFPAMILFPPPARMAGPDWNLLEDNIMGEYGVYLFLKENGISHKVAIAGSAGWDGDRYFGFEATTTGHIYLIWLTVWDSEKDAREFFVSLANIIGRWSGTTIDAEKRADAGIVSVAAENGDQYLLEKKQDSVLFLAAPKDMLPSLSRTAWKSKRRETVETAFNPAKNE